MKAWNLLKGPSDTFLTHYCANKTSLCEVSLKGWHCPECGEIPPEEIQFVADLANCNQRPFGFTTINKRSWATKWQVGAYAER